MRILLTFILIVLFAFIAGLYLPWWSIAVVAFLVLFFLYQSGIKSFVSGFLAIFFLWFVLALWIDIKNENVLSHKVGQLFGLGTSSILLIIITSLLGGLVAGFAALSGSTLRSIIATRQRRISMGNDTSLT